MIALALSCDPELIVADEPTTALDVMIQAQIMELLSRIRRELGMAMVLITHDLGVVAETCDRVVVMYGGIVAEQGSVADVYYESTASLHQAAPRGLPRPRRSRAETGVDPRKPAPGR